MKLTMIALLPAISALAVPAMAGTGTTTATAAGSPASDGDFSLCDGYSAPKGKSDGIARETYLFGAASRSADIRRGDIRLFGERGLAACDRALHDPRLIDAFWLRRANLLQAMAVHAIGAKQHERALTLTAESDALGTAHRDSYFAQSVGLGNQGVRAYALIALDRKEEADRTIDQLSASRPWSQSLRDLATRLRMHLDNRFATQSAEMKAIVPLSPERARALFWMQFLNGNYDAAREIAPAIDFVLPKQRGGWTLRGGGDTALEDIGLRARVAGAWAYAEAVAGQHDRAKALLAEANGDLDEIMAPPPPREDGRPPKKEDVADHARRLPYAKRARNELALWDSAIDFRPTVAINPSPTTQAEFIKRRLQSLPIMADILSNIPQENPAEKAEAEAAMAAIRGRLDVGRIEALAFGTDDLMEMLPRPETPKVVPTLKPAGDGYFLSDSGLSRDREGKSDIWTVRYTHRVAPIAAVEELAMLGAAQTAQREGYDSMMLLSQISISRTTNVSGMYVGSYQLNSGYEAQMRVRFVQSDALPADLAAMGWRLVPVKKVIDDLSNRYKSGGLTIAW